MNTANAGNGGKRLFMLYNYSQDKTDYVAEITLWDYEFDFNSLDVRGADGQNLQFEVLDEQAQQYWGHFYHRLLVAVNIPPMGYTVVSVANTKNEKKPVTYPPIFQRRQGADHFVLENDYIYAEFCADNAKIVSFINKQSGQQTVTKPTGFFRFITEEVTKGMSSWVQGNYQSVREMDAIRIVEGSYRTADLKQSFM